MTRTITRLTCLVVTAVASTALVTPPSGAAPTWKPVTNLFTDLSAVGGSAQTPAVAVDSRGDATAVWSRSDGTQLVVQASTRPAGSTWSAPVDLAAGWRIHHPQLVVDPAGNVTATWRRSEIDRSLVQAATRPAGGDWTAAVDLSDDAPVDISDGDEIPRLAVAADGEVTAIWSHYDGTRYTVQASTRPSGGDWNAPVDLSPAGETARTPRVAVDPAGTAVAVWNRGASRFSGGGVVQATVRPAGGTWQAPTDLSEAGGYASDPQVAIDQAGRATAVWTRLDGSYAVESASRPSGGAWSPAQRLSPAGEDTSNPQVAADHEGALAVWQRHDGSGWRVTAATRSAGGAWQPSVDLSAADHDGWHPQVALSPSGGATVVWDLAEAGSSHADSQSQASTRDLAGRWSKPVDLDGKGTESRNPQVALDAAGNATTTWSAKVGSDWIVQARGLDAAGPVVTALESRGTGARRTYVVTAHDVWSRVASARWRFADGSTATGTTVTHRDRSGTGPVRVTLTDRVGNATTCRYTGTYRCRTASRLRPAITRARLQHHRIRALGARTTAPRRTRATVVLTAAAKVTLVFTRPGSRQKVRVSKRLATGRSTLPVRARLARGKVLRPGRYTITVTAQNKAGRSQKKKLHLRVVG